jgi:hypothetical protein
MCRPPGGRAAFSARFSGVGAGQKPCGHFRRHDRLIFPMHNVTSLADYRSAPSTVFFSRRELDQILRVYGRMVADGEWRDYAISDGAERAVFSVFRRASEMPLYRIVKCPRWARRQGAWAVVAPGDHILKRGHELETVLRFFEKKRFDVID